MNLTTVEKLVGKWAAYATIVLFIAELVAKGHP